MDASLDNLPVLDWDLAKKLAGNQLDLAKEMLFILTRDLPQEVNHIMQLADDRQYTALYQAIHKLHGAVAYCGAPRLKKMLFLLEVNFKKNEFERLPVLLHQLDTEVNSLLDAYRN
ncbi:MAG: Sensor protein [uncultured bacterium]|nr:MAG: Sensor protein [uncultured bacterium]